MNASADDAHPSAPLLRAGLVRVGLAFALALGALNLVLELALAPPPELFAELAFLPRPDRLKNGRRLAGVIRSGELRAREPAVVLGLSSVRDGIDATILQAQDPGARRWIVLGTGGQAIRQLEYAAGPLLVASLRPSAVLLCIHPEWLAEVRAGERNRGAWVHRRSAADFLWMWRNRNGMNVMFRHGLDRAREHALLGLGLDIDAVFRAEEDPWSPRYTTGQGHAEPHWRDSQLGEWEERGWFDADRYHADTRQARALRGLVGDLAGRGADVTVVLMPASAAWRERTPERAAALVKEVLADHVAPDAILDLRDFLAEDQLYDNGHPNSGGRRALSAYLGRWAAEHLD